MLFVLDTNVLSELMKLAADEQVLRWFDTQEGAEFATTAINEAEILAGIALLPDGRRKRRLADAARAVFEDELGGRVLPFDSTTASALAIIVRNRTRKGIPIDFQDACIAAICRAHDAVIITRDVKGFAATGVHVMDPWELF